MKRKHRGTVLPKLVAIIVGLSMCADLAFGQPDSLGADFLSLDSLLSVTITSVSKYEQTTSEAPASVTIIAREDIQNFGYNDLGELLNGVRDLYLSNDRNYTYLGIRGFCRPSDYNNRVAVMVNGMLLNENIWGGGPIEAEFYGFNMADVERVEVIRGPASALYGTFPMLGMINIVTHTGKTQDGLTAVVETGSYGKLQGAIAAGKIFKNGLDVRVSVKAGQVKGQQLYYEEYDDSATNMGVADRIDGTYFAGTHGRVGWNGFQVKWAHTWRNIGVPTAAYGAIFNDPAFRTIDNYGSTELGYTRDLNAKMAVQGRLWTSHYTYKADYPYPEIDDGMQKEVGRGLWGGIEGRLRWDLAPNFRTLVGGDFLHHMRAQYYLSYPDSVVYDQNFKFVTFSGYLQSEWQPLHWLSLTAGGRFDRLYLGKNAFTPRIALNVHPSKSTTVKVLYGQAFRAPTIYEASVGFVGYILPNTHLRAERIHTFELVAEQRIGRVLQGVASIYTNRLTNLIEQATVMDTLLQFQNLQQVGGYGASAELTARLKRGLHFYLNYSVASMRNLDDDLWLSNSPRHMLKAGVSLQLLRHFRISPEMILQSARLTVYDTETAPFLLWNANLLFAPKSGGKAAWLQRFQWAFKMRNILNTDYRYPGGFEHLQPAIRQNGRNFNIKMMINLF